MGAALAGGPGAAVSLMVMIYAGGHIAGAHHNPAVTVAVLIRGRIDIKDAIGYWFSQLAGAALAAMAVLHLFNIEGAGTQAIGSDTILQGFMAEFIGTFALVYVVLNVATSKATAGNSYYGLAIAGTVLAMASVIGKFSGGAYNPAVAIGLMIQKSLSWSQLHIYLGAIFSGGIVAALVFRMCNPEDK